MLLAVGLLVLIVAPEFILAAMGMAQAAVFILVITFRCHE